MAQTIIETENIKKLAADSNLRHIAVIMDGNRRWAKNNCLPAAAGHKKGADSLKALVKECINLGIKYLTVYAFSTENWKREKTEVDFLMSLLAKTITTEISEFQKNDVKVRFIGDIESLDDGLKGILYDCEHKTFNNKTLSLQIAFNYGSRAEITEAVKKICKKVLDGKISVDDINEQTVSSNLYTAEIPEPDLLIRTGGEKRISNYLLWQAAYAEIYVTDTYWPEFDKNALKKAVIEFQKRHRRFGR